MAKKDTTRPASAGNYHSGRNAMPWTGHTSDHKKLQATRISSRTQLTSSQPQQQQNASIHQQAVAEWLRWRVTCPISINSVCLHLRSTRNCVSRIHIFWRGYSEQKFHVSGQRLFYYTISFISARCRMRNEAQDFWIASGIHHLVTVLRPSNASTQPSQCTTCPHDNRLVSLV